VRGERMNLITFKGFLGKIVIPTIIIVIALNLGLNNFKSKDPMKIIRNSMIAGKYDLAQDEYEKLIEIDFDNLEYHRGYIRCDIGPFGLGSLTTSGDESNIENIYENYAESEDTNISDIGNYGLDFYYSLQFENSKAESYLGRVHNQQLPFLNNTIGVNHLQSGSDDQAKEYFYKEIDYNGKSTLLSRSGIGIYFRKSVLGRITAHDSDIDCSVRIILLSILKER
jgi:tetratricopeptide (TPR) repeat protein